MMKGSLKDLFVVFIIALVAPLLFLLSHQIMSTFNQELKEAFPEAQEELEDIEEKQQQGVKSYAYGTVFAIGAMLAGIIFLASTVRFHPAFLPFAILLLIVMTYFFGKLAIPYFETLSTSFDTSQFGFAYSFLSKIHYVLCIFGFALIIVMYVRGVAEGEG